MSFSHQDSPLQRTQTSLEGLAMGDTFGKRFFPFSQDLYDHCLQERQLPATDTFWRFTDDTQMALSLINILRLHQQIDQDALIASFAAHYDPSRGHGVQYIPGYGKPYSQHHFISCKLIRAVTPLAGLPILLPKNAAALRIRRGTDEEA